MGLDYDLSLPPVKRKAVFFLYTNSFEERVPSLQHLWSGVSWPYETEVKMDYEYTFTDSVQN